MEGQNSFLYGIFTKLDLLFTLVFFYFFLFDHVSWLLGTYSFTSSQCGSKIMTEVLFFSLCSNLYTYAFYVFGTRQTNRLLKQ